MNEKTIYNIYDEIINHNSEIIKDWRNISPVFFSNALAGEVGEICNLTKKLEGGCSNKKSKEQILKEMPHEIADCFAYLIILSENLGFTKEDMINGMYEKNTIVVNRTKINKLKLEVKK